MHRIRKGCEQGPVMPVKEAEIDEPHIGGRESSKHHSMRLKAGRVGVSKQAVLGMRECDSRVKAMTIDKTRQGPTERCHNEQCLSRYDHLY